MDTFFRNCYYGAIIFAIFVAIVYDFKNSCSDEQCTHQHEESK
jgi:hypothetical protein